MRKWLVLAACLLASAANAATVVKHEVSLDLPDGWVEVPASVLQGFFDEMKRQAPLAQIPKYDYAFQASAGPPWLVSPYLLVKNTPNGRPTEHELETLPTLDLNAELKKSVDPLSALMSDSALGKMRYDKPANVVWIPSKSNVAGVGEVSGISGVIPTEKGFLELHGYAKTADFAQQLPVFEKIVTSAQVAPDLKYQPRWTDKLPDDVGGFGFKQVVFALGAGLLVGIFFTLTRRKKS